MVRWVLLASLVGAALTASSCGGDPPGARGAPDVPVARATADTGGGARPTASASASASASMAPVAATPPRTVALAGGLDVRVEPAGPSLIRVTLAGAPSKEASVELERHDGEGSTPTESLTTTNKTALHSAKPGAPYLYRFRVAGGAWSDGVEVRTATPLAPPPAPTRLSARARDPFTVELAWEGDTSAASGVELEVTTEEGPRAGTRRLSIVNPDTRSFVHTGRRPGAKYVYRVRSFNPAGTSGWSASATMQTPKLPRPAPLGRALTPCVPTPPELGRDELRAAPNEVFSTAVSAQGLLRWTVVGRARGCLRTLGTMEVQADLGALPGFEDEPYPLLYTIDGAGIEGAQFSFHRFDGARYASVHTVTLVCGGGEVATGPQLRFSFEGPDADPRAFQPPFEECQGAPDLGPP